MTVLNPPSFKMTLNGTLFHGNEDAGRVVSIEVKQVTEAPCTFKVELDDRDDKYSKATPLKEGGSAKIELGYTGDYTAVIEGTITGVSVKRADDSRKIFTVEGTDFIQKLKRGTNSQVWQNCKDSDVISELAQKASLQTEMDSTKTVHPHIRQNDISDFNFIMERAKRNGWTMFCEGKKLMFKKPMMGSMVCKLTWDASNVKRGAGEKVLKKIDFKTSTKSVPKSVTVRHYDPDQKKEIIGKSSDVLGSKMGGKKDALTITGGEGKEVTITDQPVRSVEEAEVLAFQKFNEMAGKFLQGEGSCEGDGKIRAGKIIEIDAVGDEMDGEYYVIESSHHFKVGGGADDGYTTKFKVRRSGR